MEDLTFIDESDTVLGALSIEDVHLHNHLHRSVHIFILDQKDRLLCRKIPSNSSLYAGYWSTGVGAHVPFGKSYDETARNRCFTDLGIQCSLTMIGKIRVDDGIENELSATYIGKYDEQIRPDLTKADRIQYFSREELENLITIETCTPHLIQSYNLFKKWNPVISSHRT
jgi:isopentenyldiphosphate isomerase